MSIDKKKSNALKFLESITGGPLTLGSFIEAVRLGEVISQVDFAKKLSISKAHLCDIEKGRRKVSAARAAKFAKILGYSPESFVQMAFQEEIDQEKLGLVIEVRKSPRRKVA